MKNISFSIPDGYICGLVGRNGAGKTTLMHLMLGLYRIEQGKLEIDGMHYPEQEKEIHDEIGTVLVEELLEEGVFPLEENGMLYGAYSRNWSWMDPVSIQREGGVGKLARDRSLKGLCLAPWHAIQNCFVCEALANLVEWLGSRSCADEACSC